MTLVNGMTTLRRLGAPAAADATPRQNGLVSHSAGDTFAMTAVGQPYGSMFQESVTKDGTHILRADTMPHATTHTTSQVTATTAHADAVAHTAQALATVKDSMAQAAAKADATVQPGDVMSKNDATAKVVSIYSAAFPGVGFSQSELAKAIGMLQSGNVTVDEMTAKVQEGAKLINDPSGMAAQAAEQLPGRPNAQSALAQSLRLDRLAQLMNEGYIQEGKFTVVGGFANVASIFGGSSPDGQYLQPINASSTSSGTGTQSSSSQTRAATSSASTDSSLLIQGSATNIPPQASATTSGILGSNYQVSVPKATSSSLSEASSELSKTADVTGSPVMLDLNHDGHLGVTGNSSAKSRADHDVNATVDFDLDGDGKKERIEWMNGDGDAMLVDDRDGGATAASHGSGEIDGTRLFGDQGGKYANGYEKMKALDANGDGKLTGHELDGLKAWVDDGDAKVEAGELKTLAELGVTSIDLKMQLTTNERGEQLMRSTFTQDGVEHVSEDVWFAEDQGMPNLAATASSVAERASAPSRAALMAHLDSTLTQLDSIGRQVEQTQGSSALTNQAHQARLAYGFRA